MKMSIKFVSPKQFLEGLKRNFHRSSRFYFIQNYVKIKGNFPRSYLIIHKFFTDLFCKIDIKYKNEIRTDFQLINQSECFSSDLLDFFIFSETEKSKQATDDLKQDENKRCCSKNRVEQDSDKLGVILFSNLHIGLESQIKDKSNNCRNCQSQKPESHTG